MATRNAGTNSDTDERDQKLKAGNEAAEAAQEPEATKAEPTQKRRRSRAASQVDKQEEDEQGQAPGEDSATVTIKNIASKKSIAGRKAAQTRKAKQAAEQSTVIILGLVSGLASMAFGNEARLTEYEEEMIAEPLQRILERAGFDVSEKLGLWADPLMLFMGLLAYGSRIMRLQAEKKQAAQQPPGATQEPTFTPIPPTAEGPEPPTEDSSQAPNMAAPDFIFDGIQSEQLGLGS